jgi:hypothetical protein
VWKDGFLGTNDIRGEPSDCLQQVVHHLPHLQNGERTTTVGAPVDAASPAAKCSPSSPLCIPGTSLSSMQSFPPVGQRHRSRAMPRKYTILIEVLRD